MLRVRASGWESVDCHSSPRPGDRQWFLGWGGCLVLRTGCDEARIGQACCRCTDFTQLSRRANGTGQAAHRKSEASTVLGRPVPPHPGRVGSYQRAPPDHRDRRLWTSPVVSTEHRAHDVPALWEARLSRSGMPAGTRCPITPPTQRRGTPSSEPQKPKHLHQRPPH